jgi:hypothetical protein
VEDAEVEGEEDEDEGGETDPQSRRSDAFDTHAFISIPPSDVAAIHRRGVRMGDRNAA